MIIEILTGSVGGGGFCPICKMYWGGILSSSTKKSGGGGGFCPGGFCPTLIVTLCYDFFFITKCHFCAMLKPNITFHKLVLLELLTSFIYKAVFSNRLLVEQGLLVPISLTS